LLLWVINPTLVIIVSFPGAHNVAFYLGPILMLRLFTTKALIPIAILVFALWFRESTRVTIILKL